MQKLTFRTLIKKPAQEVIEWHLRSSSLIRTIPPWEKVCFQSSLCHKGKVGCSLSLFFVTLRASLEYIESSQGDTFTLIQKKGHFKSFKVITNIIPLENNVCELVETVEYELPWFLSFLNLESRISRIFHYKHNLIKFDLEIFNRYPTKEPLRILVSGARGFVGGQLIPFLESAGHEISTLVRKRKVDCDREIFYDPKGEKIDAAQLEGFDAVIHLAGENIASGLWTEKKKRAIIASRSQGTAFLTSKLASLKQPPKTFLCASAIGIYGDRGSEGVDEQSRLGQEGFLSEVARCWEEASAPIRGRGTRLVTMRFGMILSRHGGVLKKLHTLFKWGLGGRLGSGEQKVSWIAIDDVLGGIYHLLMRSDLEGPFNFCAPESVKNKEFTKSLARAVNRWVGPPLPAFLITRILGQMGEELLLWGVRVEPKRLMESGYFFRYPTLKQALSHVI